MPRLKPPTKEESQLLPPFAALPDSAIHIPASDAAFAAARTALLAQKALGFDTESKPLFSVNQVDTGPHVVQLATPDAAWLLQLHHPQALALAREVLSHPDICKVGFGLDNDRSSLPRRLGCALENVVDLDRIFKQHGYGSSTGVRAAVALVLGQNFHKSKKTSTSNWAVQQLNPSQVRYAANDAHGPAVVYAALPAWEARHPAPPQRTPRAPRPPREAAPATVRDQAPTQAQAQVAPPRPAQPPAPTSAPPKADALRRPRMAALLQPPTPR